LPTESVSSDEIERRLQPLYQRLRLPEGRLQLLTGIEQRRFWPPGTLPSDISILSGRRAIEAADLDPQRIGVLIHASVCRDHLEPATACRVHHHLGLRGDCLIYDVSNACLGILNGILQVANMIELGQVEAGLVVGTEGGRQLVETTIEMLNRDASLTRQQIKRAVASLTIGSGSCAVLLTHRRLTRTSNHLLCGTCEANTQHHQLCQSGQDEAAGAGMRPLMDTDSESLMQEGIATGATTFPRFLDEARWTLAEVHKTFCHQVGAAHRKLMLETLGLMPNRDYCTFQWLGNSGSVALPLTMAIGAEHGFATAGDNVAMLGIGSGINCLMLAVAWQRSQVAGG
jgi:3-oxoacyl-[acyl-carrier-protein] synthase-3